MTAETIQLLTPEGERVDHPEYPVDDADIRGMYRDMVLVRRIDSEAIALQRQGELGLWASLLGQEAAQIGSAHALSPKDMAFPSYREHGVAWCRGLDPLRLLEMFRGVNHRRLGSAGAQVPPVHHRHRRPDAARHRVRDGHTAGRLRGRGGHHLLRRRRHQPGRRERGVRLGIGVQRPAGLLLPEQPVRHLRTAGAAEPGADLPAGQRLRVPRDPGRRQRRARLLRGDPPGAARRPRGRGADAHRGLYLPHGRAHHHRRPDQVPARQRARGLAAAGPDRARAVLPGPHRRGGRRLLRAGRGGGGRAGGQAARRAASRCPIRRRSRCSTTCTRSANAILDAERAQYAAYLAGFEEKGAGR